MKFYANDPLWDGEECTNLETPCCIHSNMPWFVKTLGETTTDDIELRVCGSDVASNEDSHLDVIELFVQWDNTIVTITCNKHILSAKSCVHVDMLYLLLGASLVRPTLIVTMFTICQTVVDMCSKNNLLRQNSCMWILVNTFYSCVQVQQMCTWVPSVALMIILFTWIQPACMSHSACVCTHNIYIIMWDYVCPPETKWWYLTTHKQVVCMHLSLQRKLNCWQTVQVDTMWCTYKTVELGQPWCYLQ